MISHDLDISGCWIALLNVLDRWISTQGQMSLGDAILDIKLACCGELGQEPAKAQLDRNEPSLSHTHLF
jgi:hypothetical protein